MEIDGEGLVGRRGGGADPRLGDAPGAEVEAGLPPSIPRGLPAE